MDSIKQPVLQLMLSYAGHFTSRQLNLTDTQYHTVYTVNVLYACQLNSLSLSQSALHHTHSHSEWMDGPMTGVDPDQVENDVSAMWRTLYKMEKSFSECPSPLKMAQKVLHPTHPHPSIHTVLCYRVCNVFQKCILKFYCLHVMNLHVCMY